MSVHAFLLMSGVELSPSVMSGCLFLTIEEIEANISGVLQIPRLVKQAFSELGQINNFYELPRAVMFSPHLYDIVNQVGKISFAFLGIRAIFYCLSPIGDYVSKRVCVYFIKKGNLLTLDSLKIFIQGVQKSIFKWKKILRENGATEEMKNEVSLACKEIIDKFQALGQIGNLNEQQAGRSALDQLLGIFKGDRGNCKTNEREDFFGSVLAKPTATPKKSSLSSFL